MHIVRTSFNRRRALFAGVAAAFALTALMLAGSLGAPERVESEVNGTRETVIASPPPSYASSNPNGANGSSDNATFSQDNRYARLMAYDSAASDLVRDTNGRRDVFLLRRNGLDGSLSRVSVTSRGRQANGHSIKPSISGDTRTAPRCVAFQSRATNIDPSRDRSTDWDVYVRNLSKRTTTLASPGHRNARSAVIDGECETVTYEASGYVWVRDLVRRKTSRIARGSDPDQQTNGKGVAYVRGDHVFYQPFYIRYTGQLLKTAREKLVSAGAAGRGNGRSKNPSMDDNGYYVAFQSTSTNLCTNLCDGVSGGDRNGALSDIFRRTLSTKAPTSDRMQMASYSHDANQQGNGPSYNPQISGAGEFILFDSTSTNLRAQADPGAGDPNGTVSDVFLWNFPRARKYGNVSRESKPGRTGFFNGASYRPALSSRGNYIGFTSQQSGQSGERNGPTIPDVFLRFLGDE